MIFLKPIDEHILEEVAAMGVPVLTVEDGTIEGGLGSAVADWFADHGYSVAMKRLGIPDKFITQGTPSELKAICGFDSDGIYRKIEEALTEKSDKNESR